MNAPLRKALAAAQLNETDVAAHLGVDPKTVRRWLSGQRPYPRHRWAVAEILQVDEAKLWPEQVASEQQASAPDHAQRVYAHRWQVPREVWYELFEEAEEGIGILVYSGLFLADDTGIVELLAARVRDGVKVRILLGDPDSTQVKRRGEEEGIGNALTARARNALTLLRPLVDINGAEIRLHSTVLYNSMFLTEKRMLVNQHIYGIPAAKSPVVDICIDNSSGMADVYQNNFDDIWEATHP